MGYGITQTQGNGHFTLSKVTIVLWRLLGRVSGTMANDLYSYRQTTMKRALANRRTLITTNGFFMLARRMTCLSTTCTCVTYERIKIKTCGLMGLYRGTLTGSRCFMITLALKIGVQATLTTTCKGANGQIFRDLLGTRRFGCARVSQQIRTGTTLMEACHTIGLGAMTTICIGHTIIIGPQGSRCNYLFQYRGPLGGDHFLVLQVSLGNELCKFGGLNSDLTGFKLVIMPYHYTIGRFIGVTRF